MIRQFSRFANHIPVCEKDAAKAAVNDEIKEGYALVMSDEKKSAGSLNYNRYPVYWVITALEGQLLFSPTSSWDLLFVVCAEN